MLKIVAICIGLSSFGAFAAPTLTDIHNTIDEIHFAVDHNKPTGQELTVTQESLQKVLDVLNRKPSKLMCSKYSNGLFYPVRRNTGDVVGDSDYRAGFGALNDCKAVLPKPTDTLVCFKRANGLFYPTDPADGRIVGSPDYRAGFGALADCQEAIR